MALTPEQLAEAEAQFRSDLQAEHDARTETMRRRKDKARQKRQSRDAERRQIELTEVQERVREEFYKEQGYQLYTDSTGREVWLSPDEFEYRNHRRKARKKRREYEPAIAPQGRVILFYVAMFLLAVLIGIMLAR